MQNYVSEIYKSIEVSTNLNNLHRSFNYSQEESFKFQKLWGVSECFLLQRFRDLSHCANLNFIYKPSEIS